MLQGAREQQRADTNTTTCRTQRVAAVRARLTVRENRRSDMRACEQEQYGEVQRADARTHPVQECVSIEVGGGGSRERETRGERRGCFAQQRRIAHSPRVRERSAPSSARRGTAKRGVR